MLNKLVYYRADISNSTSQGLLFQNYEIHNQIRKPSGK